MNPSPQLKISSQNVAAIAKSIIAINVLLLAGTFIFTITHSHLLKETDLASENVFAAWYSSILLLLSAVFSLFCFIIDQQRFKQKSKRIWNFGWLIYSAAFATLSFDELGSIHEHIGNFAAFKQAGNLVVDTKDSGWIFFYVLVGGVSLIILIFSLLKLRKAKWSLFLMITGMLLYLSNPFQEYFEIESMRAAVGHQSWKRPVHLLLLEEGSELFGSLCFLSAIMLYAKDYTYTIKINESRVMRFMIFFLIAAAICLTLINILFGDVKGDEQNGVPKNWITAAVTFLLSLYCFFMYNKEKINGYLLFGLFSLCISVYFGSNRFAWYFNADFSPGRLFLKSIFSLFAFISMMSLIIQSGNRVFKFLAIISTFIVIAGIFIKRQYSAELVFTGIGCFSVLLVADRFRLFHRQT